MMMRLCGDERGERIERGNGDQSGVKFVSRSWWEGASLLCNWDKDPMEW
ncbi:hypothetical protein COLO4_06518 [Corchorus olitorius]|uniref:Uncharacterized protein n=1 Tax=Corchorus olitorius TaxID=93759 RepID=A0A1R3KMS6_9ROSI|nr:hypothetical protein COLO4_06518 [Corchorus olitorius]